MAGYEESRDELRKLGVSVYAASVDRRDAAREVADQVSFPIGQGVTRDVADRIGAWWEERRGIVQPSEFLLRRDGTILQSTYSDGPLGRIGPEEVCRLVGFLSRG